MSEAELEPVSSRPVRRAKRRAELLDSTLTLIRREGPLVSMDRIAAECGVTKPIIYRYFGDREGLVHEVACRLVAEFAKEMHVATRKVTTARAQLAATMDAYLAVVERDSNLYRFINHHTSIERRDVFGRLVADHFATEFSHWLRGSTVPPEAASTWGYALVGILHFASDWWSGERTIPRAELVDQLMTMVWDGLGQVRYPERHHASERS